MGLEKELRKVALRIGLKEIRIVVYFYHLYYKFLYRKKWDQPVSFRGGRFLIGKDLSLFPAIRNGGFEELEIDSILPLIKAKDVVWDVGANVGIYSFLLSRAASQGYLIAFEPVPETQEKWRKNFHSNSLVNCTLEPIALSDKVGLARIRVNENAHGCDAIELENAMKDDVRGFIQIQTTTGDEFLRTASQGDPDVIKVDIEGHEPEFLRGCWTMLARRKPILMLEVNPTTWKTLERFAIWQGILEELFTLYGDGLWFEPKGKSRVSSVDVQKLGPHPYSLIFQSTST